MYKEKREIENVTKSTELILEFSMFTFFCKNQEEPLDLTISPQAVNWSAITVLSHG